MGGGGRGTGRCVEWGVGRDGKKVGWRIGWGEWEGAGEDGRDGRDELEGINGGGG